MMYAETFRWVLEDHILPLDVRVQISRRAAQTRERSADPKSGDEWAESPTVGRPQADERDPGADGPHARRVWPPGRRRA